MLGSLIDRDNWHEIWAVLRANRLRATLTAFGVAWGIFMLIVMLGFGSAMQSGTQRNMKGMATNMLWVWPQTTTIALRPAFHAGEALIPSTSRATVASPWAISSSTSRRMRARPGKSWAARSPGSPAA